MDPLGADPIVTGSANFSDASTRKNDENMIIVRGDRRAADIYFTEFNKLFNHYYFRGVHQKTAKQPKSNGRGNLFLQEKPSSGSMAICDSNGYEYSRRWLGLRKRDHSDSKSEIARVNLERKVLERVRASLNKRMPDRATPPNCTAYTTKHVLEAYLNGRGMRPFHFQPGATLPPLARRLRITW